MKKGHIPLRKCIVCQGMFPKAELIRMVISKKDKKIYLDLEGKKSGKGVYLCPRRECLETFLKNKKYRKRFHSVVSEEAMNYIKNIAESKGCLL